MAEPGWYNAAGDPPGTQRYWDGSQWVSDAVYEPTAPASYAYVGGPIVGASTFPSGLKTLAIVMSVLKAIPLVFGIIGLIIIAAAARDFNDQFDDFGLDLGGLLGAALATMAAIIVVGALLLAFQFAGAIKERPLMVFVPALVMTLLDGLVTVGSWLSWNEARNSPFLEQGPGGAVFVSAVFVAQAYIAVQSLRANSR